MTNKTPKVAIHDSDGRLLLTADFQDGRLVVTHAEDDDAALDVLREVSARLKTML